MANNSNKNQINKRLKKVIKLQDKEKCVLIIRKHWFIFVRDAFFIFLTFLVLWAGLTIVLRAFQVREAIITFWQSFTALAGLLVLFVHWTNYFLDMWIITDERLVDIDQERLFVRKVTATRIDLIQDISAKTPGFIATLLNFGNVTVQTAGAAIKNIHIEGVPNPNYIRQILLKYLDFALSKQKHN